MAKVSKEEAQDIYKEIAARPLYNSETMYQIQTMEQCRLAGVKKMSQMIDQAAQTAMEIMTDSEAKDGDRLKAAQMVLNYGIGRPREVTYVDDSADSRQKKADRIIIEGQVSPQAVREAIGAAFYREEDEGG